MKKTSMKYQLLVIKSLELVFTGSTLHFLLTTELFYYRMYEGL